MEVGIAVDSRGEVEVGGGDGSGSCNGAAQHLPADGFAGLLFRIFNLGGTLKVGWSWGMGFLGGAVG